MRRRHPNKQLIRETALEQELRALMVSLEERRAYSREGSDATTNMSNLAGHQKWTLSARSLRAVDLQASHGSLWLVAREPLHLGFIDSDCCNTNSSNYSS